MTIIEKLPEELERRLPEIRDEWIRIGLSTEPADREMAEKGVDLAYRAAGLEPPKIKIWLNSPLEGGIGVALLINTKQAGAQVQTQVWDQVRAQIWDQVLDQARDQVQTHNWDQVRAQIWGQVWGQILDQIQTQVQDQVLEQVWDQVWGQIGKRVTYQTWAQFRYQFEDQVLDQVGEQALEQVGNQVATQVGAQVWAQVWSQIRDQFQDQVGDQVLGQVWGQIWDAVFCRRDTGWLAGYKVFESLIPETKKLNGFWLLAQSCGWWWPFENAVILTERPNRLIRDETGRLHSECGPALTHPDGFSIYAWHGYGIPNTDHWIITDKSKLTPDTIDAEPNAEIRRIMLEIHGFENYLNQRPHKVLDEDINLGQPRRLLETQVGDETIKILDVTNGSDEPDGSRRRFFLGAIAGATTVHEAVAMSYGIDTAYYREGVRT